MSLLHLKGDFMKEKNKNKVIGKMQIEGKMPVSIHFFRDAEADAIKVKREQLDRATLISSAVQRIRDAFLREDSSDKEKMK